MRGERRIRRRIGDLREKACFYSRVSRQSAKSACLCLTLPGGLPPGDCGYCVSDIGAVGVLRYQLDGR